MTTTAGTLCSAAHILAEHGAKDVYAAVTHAAITDLAVENLKKSAIRELVTTDTIPPIQTGGFPVTVLSMAELLAEAISRIHEDRSVSSLLQL
jgi:ribose-phosphate pyrophosphokinase